jgi:aspartyl aminopeptidase
MKRRSLSLALALVVSACGGSAATSPQTPEPATQKAKIPKAPEGEAVDVDALFPEDKSGWKAVGADQKAQIASFAASYLDFLSRTGTQRKSAGLILEQAIAAGARPFGGSKHKSGELLYWRDEAQSSIALFKIGERPPEEGLRVIIASLDAGVIRLTPTPIYDKKGLALFDTTILGDLKLASWLNTPLLLNVRVAASGKTKAREITIGDELDEPVFTIPDLLPHLSRKVQRKGLIDTPERLDAIAGFSTAALAKAFRRFGLSPSDWNRAEADLLPASQASYIGVDRALIASANHYARALPFAATRALLESDAKHSSLLILMGHSERSYAGADAEAHMLNLLPRAIAQQRAELDALDLRRIMARTRVLLFDNAGGERNKGLVLNSRKDDSTPEAFRHVMQVFDKAGLQYQIAEDSGWSEAREVASLDLDAVEIGLPIAGVGTPNQLLSTLDLYQALLACQGWVSQ